MLKGGTLVAGVEMIFLSRHLFAVGQQRVNPVFFKIGPAR